MTVRDDGDAIKCWYCHDTKFVRVDLPKYKWIPMKDGIYEKMNGDVHGCVRGESQTIRKPCPKCSTLPSAGEAVRENKFDHTPGPWRYLEDHDGDAAGHPLTICDANDNDLANVYSRDDATVPFTRDEAIANARLIARAPEMAAEIEGYKSDVNKFCGEVSKWVTKHTDRGKDLDEAITALKTALSHIDNMSAWITKKNAGYSFEGLNEDMWLIKKPLEE